MTASTGERDDRDQARDLPEGPGDIPADTFALRLLAARHHAGRLSIEKAAERCGLNSENWRRWEDGALPRDKVDVAQAISTGLDINFNWLLLGGALLPARGRPVKRTTPVRRSYLRVSDHPRDTRPPGGPQTGDVGQTVRRNRLIVRNRPVAA